MHDNDSKADHPQSAANEPDQSAKNGKQWLGTAQQFADSIDTVSRNLLTRLVPWASLPTVRTGLIIAAVLLFDWLTPLWIEAGVLYMAAVLSAVPIRHSRAVYYTAVVCTSMVFVGWMISPASGDTEVWRVAVNRGLSLGIIWATAAMADSWTRLQKRRLKQLQESRLLQQATALAASEISFQQALQNSLKSLCDILGWPVGHVYVREHERKLLVASDIWHLPDDGRFGLLRNTAKTVRFSQGEGAAGKVWESGDALAVRDVAKAPEYDWLKEPERLGVKAAFAFPITVGGNVAAVIECFSGHAVDVDPDSLSLAHSIGQQLGRLFERKRAEETLRESEQRLRLALEGGQMGTWFWDLRTNQRKWDRREDELLGLDPTADVERNEKVFFDRVHPEDREELRRTLEESIKTGTSYEHEYRIVRPNGDVRWLAGKGEVRRDSSGEPVAMFGVNFDITRRKQVVDEIKRAKEAAEVSNQLRTQFLANVSHELRTPLNSILGMLHLALDDDLTDTQRDWLATAHNSAELLHKLVNDLLDFSKLEAGQFQIVARPFTLRNALENVIRPLSTRAFEKDVELVYYVQPRTPDLLIGDSDRLRQVLVNLVSNAIKFTDHGEVVLRVELETLFPHDAKLVFTISDTGAGISSDDQQRIFEPFTQVDASSTRQFGGVGLGLTISKELVQRMGGHLSVESSLGRGSRFWFSINFQRQQDAAAGTSMAPQQLTGTAVLVVDDNATNREALKECLAYWNLSPDVAVDGDHAVGRLQRAAAEHRKYSVIIVDAVMPGMDGIELTTRIRDLDGAPRVILMIPPGDQRRFRERGAAIPIATYLEKPVSPAGLLDALTTTLNVQPLSKPALQPATTRAETANNSLSVLLVEDTPANQKVIASMLQRRGHKLTIAQNGEEALDCFRQEAFDVVLMDVQMPVVDGYEATKMIRAHEDGNQHTPVIAMTAHALPGDREKCLAAGMDSYISKPIDVAQLIAVVESIGNGSLRSLPDSKGQADSTAALDFESAMARLGGDLDLYREFIEVFDEDLPGLIASIRRAVDQNDAPALERTAHTLKGLAGNVGATACAASARALEDLGSSGSLNGAVKLVSQLERDLAQLDRALQRYRQVT